MSASGTKKAVRSHKAGEGARKHAKGQAEQEIKLQPSIRTRGLFTKDLITMLYGFGDAETPYQETVDLVEDIVVEYITTLLHTAMGQQGPGQKISPEDIQHLVQNDPPKAARVRQLLLMNEELKTARKFDVVSMEENLKSLAAEVDSD